MPLPSQTPRMLAVVVRDALDWGYVPEPWTERALCAQTDPALFTADEGAGRNQAVAVCQRCEVREECLESALDVEVDQPRCYTVRGGLLPSERNKLIHDRKRFAS